MVEKVLAGEEEKAGAEEKGPQRAGQQQATKRERRRRSRNCLLSGTASPSLGGAGGSLQYLPPSPSSRRIQATSSYIYDTMFLKGTDSDVTITALGECQLASSARREGREERNEELHTSSPSSSSSLPITGKQWKLHKIYLSQV